MDTLGNEFGALKQMITRCILVVVVLFTMLLTCTIQEVSVLGQRFPIVAPGSPSLAVQFFLFAKETLIPVGIPVVALGPVSSFVAPILMAFLVALLLSFPFGIYFMSRFLSPALHPAERKALARFIIPALILFYLGCSLAYFVIIPETFAILYSFASPMGVAPFFALDEFISSVFFLTLTTGIAFLLPVGMTVLSRIGLISGYFWMRHIRIAIMIVLIFSALITPDGSGVTMVFLSAPLLLLYLVGALLAKAKTGERA